MLEISAHFRYLHQASLSHDMLLTLTHPSLYNPDLTQPALGLIDEAEFVIVDAHRADRTFTQVEGFMANGRALAP
jgi:hypothetical protein